MAVDPGTQRTWGQVRTGMHLYASSSRLTDTAYTGLIIFRRIRLINAKDIQKMNIPEWQKLKLIVQLDTNKRHNKPVMIFGDTEFNVEDMFKQHTSYIGDYIKSDSISRRYEEKDYDHPPKWHAIKPNPAIKSMSEYATDVLPDGYVYANDYYYVYPGMHICHNSIF